MDEVISNKFEAVTQNSALNATAAAGINAFHRIDIGKAFIHLMNHYSEHGIHTGEELIRALRNAFRNVDVSEGGTYLYRYFVTKMESLPEGGDFIKAIFEWEEIQIEKRFIQGIGLRVVGFK